MIRALITLAVIFIIYRIYRFTFLEKRCIACGKHIRKDAPICRHCNSMQTEGVVIETTGSQNEANSSETSAHKLHSPPGLALIATIQIAVVAALYFPINV